MALIDVNWKPGARELRQFALLFFIFAIGFGTAFRLFPGFFEMPPVLSPVLWVAGALVGLLGLVAPIAVRPVYVVMMAVALPIGMVVSTVLMVVIFFLVLTPIGLLMRLFGYDPMHRRFEPAAATYYIRREPTTDPARYFRQF